MVRDHSEIQVAARIQECEKCHGRGWDETHEGRGACYVCRGEGAIALLEITDDMIEAAKAAVEKSDTAQWEDELRLGITAALEAA